MSELQIYTWKKKFNWKGIEVDGAVTREGIIKWNKNNPDYFLRVYAYDGITKDIKKSDFIHNLKTFQDAPLLQEQEGKIPINLLLLTSPSKKNSFITMRAPSKMVNAYLRKGHFVPIIDVERMFSLGGNRPTRCSSCGDPFSSEKARDNHVQHGCKFKYEPPR